MTVYLTEYFAIYFYGYYELQRMRENRTGLYEPLPPEPGRRYNEMGVYEPLEPNLGKNIFAVKIFVPGKLKQALQLLAEQSGITLGQCARLLLCAHLFGREYGIRGLNAMATEETRPADVWESKTSDE